MPTDQERREVAERLRSVEVWDDWEDGAVLCDARDVEYALELDPVDSWFTKASVDHLADLIDRPTTTRHGKFKTKYGRETPCCEVCGYSIGDDRWNYCPKCGAEVVE